MEKETPYEKKLRELKEAYEKEVAEAKKEYQEDIESAMKETPTEEWENQLELAIAQSAPFSLTNQWSDADFTPVRNLFSTYITSHNAELRRKIEKFIDENDDGMWAGRETADAVLALLGKENV